jgi:ribonuclease T1
LNRKRQNSPILLILLALAALAFYYFSGLSQPATPALTQTPPSASASTSQLTTHVASKAPTATRGADLKAPQYAYDVLNYIMNHNGQPMDGYVGGSTFGNYEKLLPKGVSYREYDVHLHQNGVNRGAERLVLGDDGSAWYTSDHYVTFVRIK